MTSYVAWPNAFRIAPAKVTRYLLDPAGSSPGKARWWLAQGFTAEEAHHLHTVLFAHTTLTHFAGTVPSPWGHRLIFEGPIQSPSGSTPRIRSVWQVGPEGTPGRDDTAWLITAHRI